VHEIKNVLFPRPFPNKFKNLNNRIARLRYENFHLRVEKPNRLTVRDKLSCNEMNKLPFPKLFSQLAHSLLLQPEPDGLFKCECNNKTMLNMTEERK